MIAWKTIKQIEESNWFSGRNGQRNKTLNNEKQTQQAPDKTERLESIPGLNETTIQKIKQAKIKQTKQTKTKQTKLTKTKKKKQNKQAKFKQTKIKQRAESNRFHGRNEMSQDTKL